MSRIIPSHWQEWRKGSGIHPDIIRLNLESLDSEEAFEALLYSEKISRTNPGRLTAGWLKRYHHLHSGGWWCSGLDPLNNWEPMRWGCLKPNEPRTDSEGKTIKYEHPPKTEPRAFFLRVSLEIWKRISERHKVPLPENIIITEDGEALGFWRWVMDNPHLQIEICEGVKKAAALLSAGRIAIAIPGINSGYRVPRNELGEKIGKPYLIPELAALCSPAGRIKRPINFVFDQDSKYSTKQAVNQAIKKTGKLFSRNNCEVFVTEWESSLGKGIDDVLSNFGEDIVEGILKQSISLGKWEILIMSRLNYQANTTVNRRYLVDKDGDKYIIPEELKVPAECQVLFIKSPKNTGKTEYLSVLTNSSSEARKILLITHRTQLGQALCDRLKIPYIRELAECDEGKLLGYGLCHHSLFEKSSARFKPQEWEGADIIIDELVQVLWDILTSPLIEKNQVQILQNLAETLQTALSTGGRLIACDADLDDWAVSYILKLIGFKVKTHLIVNEWSPVAERCNWEVFNYEGKKPTALVYNLIQHIENGGKPFVLCSSQEENSPWSTQNLEVFLSTKFPSLKILRIDAESVADPTHPAFGCTSSLNQILPEYDIALASPTLETGVDIKCENFDSVWGIFWGVQTCDGVRQFLARYRRTVVRHIWINKIGLTKIGNGEPNPKALWVTQNTITQQLIYRLKKADFTDEFDTDFQPVSVNAYTQRGALINLQRRHYRESILDKLNAEGHILINAKDEFKFNSEELKKLQTDLENNRDRVYVNYCNSVKETGNPDDVEFDKLKKQKVRTKNELNKLEHGALARRYQVPVTPELVAKDDDGWHPRIKLHYHLTIGRKFVEAKDKQAASTHLKNGNGKVWKPTFNKRQMGLKIEFLENMGILEIFSLNEIRAKDVEPIVEFGRKYSHDLKAVGITANWDDKPISVIKNLLRNLFGLTITRLRRENRGGSREWVYTQVAVGFERDEEGHLLIGEDGRAIAKSDGREEVFKQWLERDIAKAEATASEVKKEEASDSVVEPPTVELSPTQEAIAQMEAGNWSEEAVQYAVTLYGLEVVDDAIAFCPAEVRSLRREQLDKIRLAPPEDDIEANAQAVRMFADAVQGDEDEQREQWEAIANTVRETAALLGQAFLSAVQGLLNQKQWVRLEALLA